MTQKDKMRFVKYKRVKEILRSKDISNLEGSHMYVFEKIDGGNCQVRNINGKLYAGSKSNFLKGDILARTKWFPRLVGWMYSNTSLYCLPTDVVLFGEWSGNHTITYAQANTDKFFVIDLFDLKQGRFVPYDRAVDFIRRRGITGVRFLDTLARGKIEQEIIEDLILNKPSHYYPGKKEGLVIKDYSSTPQSFYKLLSSGFEERRKNLFGKSDPFTEARFRKNFIRVIEESGENVPLQELIEIIRTDVKRETGREYDFDYVKKKLGSYLSRRSEKQ